MKTLTIREAREGLSHPDQMFAAAEQLAVAGFATADKNQAESAAALGFTVPLGSCSDYFARHWSFPKISVRILLHAE